MVDRCAVVVERRQNAISYASRSAPHTNLSHEGGLKGRSMRWPEIGHRKDTQKGQLQSVLWMNLRCRKALSTQRARDRRDLGRGCSHNPFHARSNPSAVYKCVSVPSL